ncbi:MAG: hypothetical protein ACOCUS_01780 [Polyangiales bacterium]
MPDARPAVLAARDAPLSKLDAATLRQAADVATAIAEDPNLLRELQMALRELGRATKTQTIHNEQQTAEHQQELRMKALEAARKGGGLLPGKLGEVLKVVAVAAALAASAVTGGASLGLAVAGAALMLAGPEVTKGLVKAGVVDEKAAMGLDIAIQVVGAALMAGAGAAGGAQTAGQAGTQAAAETGKATAQAGAEAAQVGAEAAQVGTEAAKLGEQAAKIEDVVTKAVEWIRSGKDIYCGVDQVEQAGVEVKNAKEMRSADRHGMRRDEAVETADDAVDGLAHMLEQFRRMAAKLRAVAEAKEQARAAVIRSLA